ncbi:hypothetical protein ABXT08_09885 [Chryseobacterium sp. NRRL B-14859]|uniref:hypothetical protein n=1 Tax=Chryseobacterium sp. NRRL B-14859 TaxID=1562763 RepID=UPI00339A37EC
MKTNLLMVATTLFLTTTISAQALTNQVGINTFPDASADLHVASDPSKIRGTLLNPVTKDQRISINSPASGLIVFDKTRNCLMVNAGTKEKPDWKCSFEVIPDPKPDPKPYPQPDPEDRKHFYGSFKVGNMTTTDVYSVTYGTKPPDNTYDNVVGYSTLLNPSNLSKVPVIDGIRMNVVFKTKGVIGTLYNPIIENISGKDIPDFALINQSTISGSKRIQHGILGNNKFVNVDPDNITYYDRDSFEEVRALFTHQGKLYRCTWWGYFDENDQEHDIHMTMEVFN